MSGGSVPGGMNCVEQGAGLLGSIPRRSAHDPNKLEATMTELNPTGGGYHYYADEATAGTTIPPSENLLLPTAPVESTGETTRKAMQMVTYIVVIITCMAVLITLGFAWHTYFQISAALDNLQNSFHNSGTFGN